MNTETCHRNNTRITFAILDTEGREIFTLTEYMNTARLMRGNGMGIAMYNALDAYADASCPLPGASGYDLDLWKADAQGSIAVKYTNRAIVSAEFEGTSVAILDLFPGMDDVEEVRRFYAA